MTSLGLWSFCWRSDERRNVSLQKCLFEPRSLIKNRKKIRGCRRNNSPLSLHHNSNFPRLFPPALWRDPGHCAGGGRRATERITHPGKTAFRDGCWKFFFFFFFSHRTTNRQGEKLSFCHLGVLKICFRKIRVNFLYRFIIYRFIAKNFTEASLSFLAFG